MIELVLLCGLGGFYLTRLLRLLWPVRNWFALGRKPWACDVCMSTWSSVPFVAGLALLAGEWIRLWWVLPSAGVCLVLLTVTRRTEPPANRFGPAF